MQEIPDKMSPFEFFLKKYKLIEDDYMNRTPREKWMCVRGFGQFILKLNGVAFIDRNFKPTWHSYVPAVVLIDILLSSFYTGWYYYRLETIKGFLVVSLFGFFTSVRITECSLHFLIHSSGGSKI